MKKRKVLISIISIALCFLCSFSTVSANDIYTGDYFEFDNPFSRMDSDGTFTFCIASRIESDVFTADKAYVTIGTTASVYDRSEREEFTSSSDTYAYTVKLMKYSTGSMVGSYTAYSDGTRYGQSYSVKKGDKYYLEIVAVNRNLKLTSYQIDGTGYVKNVTVD